MLVSSSRQARLYVPLQPTVTANSLLLPVPLFSDTHVCNGTNKSVAANQLCAVFLKQVRQVEKVTSCKMMQGRDHCCYKGSAHPNM